MQSLSLPSPGKVNLRLEVIGKRPDGFHELRSLMERVNIADEIEMKIVEKGITVSCDDESVPCDENNIAFKAVKEILAYSSRNVGVDIKIKKQIPVAAGMGGGSSNAATVIKGINHLLKLKLSKEKLMKIGLKVGADVPFFLFEGPALAEGIGEQLKKIKAMPRLLFLIANPNIPVRTEWVYGKYSLEAPKGNGHCEVPNAYRTKKDVAKILHNDLERVTIKEYPVIGEIKEEMLKLGALASQMTGSGPTVFGIFADKVKLQKAYERMEKKAAKGWKIFMAENLEESKG
ncbi:MAG TPA: 4-(cytidine 5'-diphospho)-2-C-methyl-D-erythritol kinase [Deltaproteobacteria bacterium]|nr:4-(cytidine 5'-diphospho)-2-C-methyl-D-erythritol kinase [Deltaproteobacteria bacterium]